MPEKSHPINAPREDDGYFGPDSVSWKVFADPSARLGGMAGLLLQALNPHMMRLFINATVAHSDPAGRDERTGRYLDTITFGDRAHADAAAASVRRMHDRAEWEDPRTGQVLRATEPAWIDWTHNALIYGLLQAADAFGLDLTEEEQDRFIVEQHIAAELMGSEAARLPASRAELDAYVDEQKDWMSLSLPAAEVTRTLRAPILRGNPIKVYTSVVIQDGVLSILPDWARLLYGIEGRPMNLRAAARTTKRMIGIARRSSGYSDVITSITTRIDDHPYRKVRPAK